LPHAKRCRGGRGHPCGSCATTLPPTSSALHAVRRMDLAHSREPSDRRRFPGPHSMDRDGSIVARLSRRLSRHRRWVTLHLERRIGRRQPRLGLEEGSRACSTMPPSSVAGRGSAPANHVSAGKHEADGSAPSPPSEGERRGQASGRTTAPDDEVPWDGGPGEPHLGVAATTTLIAMRGMGLRAATAPQQHPDRSAPRLDIEGGRRFQA